MTRFLSRQRLERAPRRFRSQLLNSHWLPQATPTQFDHLPLPSWGQEGLEREPAPFPFGKRCPRSVPSALPFVLPSCALTGRGDPRRPIFFVLSNAHAHAHFSCQIQCAISLFADRPVPVLIDGRAKRCLRRQQRKRKGTVVRPWEGPNTRAFRSLDLFRLLSEGNPMAGKKCE